MISLLLRKHFGTMGTDSCFTGRAHFLLPNRQPFPLFHTSSSSDLSLISEFTYLLSGRVIKPYRLHLFSLYCLLSLILLHLLRDSCQKAIKSASVVCFGKLLGKDFIAKTTFSTDQLILAGDKQHISPTVQLHCESNNRTPVTLWHNVINIALIAIILYT